MRTALLALLLPLAGCASSHVIDIANPADLARAEATVVGRQAEIALASGARYAGRVEFLRPDSAAWTAGADVYVVPTPDLRSVSLDDRRRALGRGAFIGAGASFGVCFLLGAGFSDELGGRSGDNLLVGAIVGAGCAPGGALYGLLGGALVGSRTTLTFAGSPAPAPPDGDAPPGDAPPDDGSPDDGSPDDGSAGDGSAGDGE